MKSASVGEWLLKESGWLDSYLFALSFFLPFDSDSDWSQFITAELVGKLGQEEVLANFAWKLFFLCFVLFLASV